MADNKTANAGDGLGATFVTRQISHAGDTADLAGSFLMGITGTEGSYTAAAINGDATNGLDVDVTRVSGTVTVGNAGTFAVQVDGDALTALQTIDNSVFADDAAFTLASSSVTMAGAIRDDSLSTLTAIEGDAVPLRVSATGALHVTGGGGGTEYNEDAATPATITGTASLMERDDALSTVTPIEGDWIGMRGTAEGALWTQDFNSDALLTAAQAVQTAVEGTLTVGSHAVTNAGTFAVQVTSAPSTAVTNAGTFAVQAAQSGTWTVDLGATDNAVLDAIAASVGTLDNAISGSEMQVDVVGALPAGTNAIGKLAANSGVDIGDVDVTSISAGSNLIGDVGISGARTSGGTTIFRSIDLDESEEEVKATAGQVYWIHAMNLAATKRYLKVYNATAASVTVGTTTPVLTFALPTQGDTNGAGFTLAIPNGIAFSTAITVAATTGVADSDTGAPGANEVIVNLGYA